MYAYNNLCGQGYNVRLSEKKTEVKIAILPVSISVLLNLGNSIASEGNLSALLFGM